MGRRWILGAGGVLAVSALAGLGLFRVREGQDAASLGASGGDIRVVSQGSPLNLRDHLAAGKYTLFDYYADWCPPCRELSPQLENLARRHPNLALRKIDIVSWSHPVAQQQEVRDLPFLRLYDPEGRLVGEGDAALEGLQRLFGFKVSPQLM
ncbi:MAG TPA: thioredoxin family protein [Candidatus Polarisedimenticolia bacterium]|nr:thioredoxin family protein [Candidatus Polarisedimenticolia bacterium]